MSEEDSYGGRRPATVISAATLVPLGVYLAGLVLMVNVFMGGLDLFVTRMEFDGYKREVALRQARTDEILVEMKQQLDRIEALAKGRR